jgi:hypothetical protein
MTFTLEIATFGVQKGQEPGAIALRQPTRRPTIARRVA